MGIRITPLKMKKLIISYQVFLSNISKKREHVYVRSVETSIVQTAGYVIIGILIQLALVKTVQVYTRKKRNFKYTFWTFFAGVELSLISIVGFEIYFHFNPCYGQFYCGFGQGIALLVCLITSALLILLSLIFYLFEYYRTPTEPQVGSTPDYIGKIRLGLLTMSLILGFIAVTGNSWMSLTFEDDDGHVFADLSLNEISVDDDLEITSFDYDEFCGDGAKEKDMTDFLALDYAYSDDPVQFENDDEKYCNLGTVGLLTTTVLWLAIISGAVTIFMHLFGVVNRVPMKIQFVFSWGTGALMLIGTLGWAFTNPYQLGFPPDFLGGSFLLGLIAGLFALSGEIVNTYFAKQDE